jgi:hypothetical protein
MDGYRVLTPKFRAEIDLGFDRVIAELQECEKNALVSAQIEGLKMAKRYINGLPDGTPIPVSK